MRSRKRGLDLNFYQKRFCPHSHDYSEILTPGYRVSRSTPLQLVCVATLQQDFALPQGDLSSSLLLAEYLDMLPMSAARLMLSSSAARCPSSLPPSWGTWW